jgi:prepilin-type N-terminal cleavage/methylation domain-containing protein
MRLFTPRRSGSTSLLDAGESGFTLAEMVVVVAIVALTTAWAVPQFTRGIEQNKVDNYAQNLHTGLFNLRKRVQKSSKTCELFKQFPSASKVNYISPNMFLELSTIVNRDNLLDCSMGTAGPQSISPFRFLQLEGSDNRDSVEVLYLQRQFTPLGNTNLSKITQDKYDLTNLATNPDGNDMIFRIRSKKWDQDTSLKTRCIVFPAVGILTYGRWSYTQSECFKYCPKGDNCNRAGSIP